MARTLVDLAKGACVLQKVERKMPPLLLLSRSAYVGSDRLKFEIFGGSGLRPWLCALSNSMKVQGEGATSGRQARDLLHVHFTTN